MKGVRKKIYNFLNKIEKLYYALIAGFIFADIPNTIYADSPALVSGTVKLFQNITAWLLLIIPVGAGAFLAFHATQKALSDDQAVIAEKNKLMKNAVIGAAVAESASGLITLILGYYSG